jgi:hypothetical protein
MNNDNLEKDATQESGDDVPHSGNIFQPTWIRCIIQNGNGLNRFLLDYYFHFLLRLSILLWVIFFIQKSI